MQYSRSHMLAAAPPRSVTWQGLILSALLLLVLMTTSAAAAGYWAWTHLSARVALGAQSALISLPPELAVRASLDNSVQVKVNHDLRVRVLGLHPYLVKLFIATAAAILAVIAGIGFVLLQSGTTPRITTSDFTLTLLVIVVLGGVGFRWGAIVGALIYTILDQRLATLANSDFVEGLPLLLHVPLSEPLFILGTLFVLVVMFVPGGVAGTATRLGRGRTRSGLARVEAATEDSTARAGGAGLGHANS